MGLLSFINNTLGSVVEIIPNLQHAITRYYLTITGLEDGLEDIEIPMSSFQARRRSHSNSYLSVVIPTLDFSTDVVDRSNGTMRVEQSLEWKGKTIQRETLLETTMDTIALHQGGSSNSLVLTGYVNESITPKSIGQQKSSYRTISNGVLRHRIASSFVSINPGDTVIIDNDTLVAMVIAYAISDRDKTIEISDG